MMMVMILLFQIGDVSQDFDICNLMFWTLKLLDYALVLISIMDFQIMQLGTKISYQLVFIVTPYLLRFFLNLNQILTAGGIL